jgi:hypothetical protein
MEEIKKSQKPHLYKRPISDQLLTAKFSARKVRESEDFHERLPQEA